MNVLVIDVGGSNVKVRATGQPNRVKFPSGPDYTPDQLTADLAEAIGDARYDAVTVGFPAPVVGGKLPAEPKNLGNGWVDFDFERTLERPVKLINDAAMQAVGSYEGGRMLFFSLGTGLGAALIADWHVIPLELCELRWSRHKTLEGRLGKTAAKRLGAVRWEQSVHATLEMLKQAFVPDYIVVGGGLAKDLQHLPDYVRRGHNNDALTGGEVIWTEERFRL